MTEHIRRLFHHMSWANDRLIMLLQNRDRDADAGKRATRLLAHVIAAERIWLLRATGGDASNVPIWPDWSLGDTARISGETRSGYQRLLDDLDESDLLRSVEYRNSRNQAFHTELGDILLHVAVHGSYHRGQIAAAVRRGGDEPINTDYIKYVRENAAT